MSNKNTYIDKWVNWLATITDDVERLIVNQKIYYDVIKIVSLNNNINIKNEFYGYFNETYACYRAMGMRRQLKSDDTSISLKRFLQDIQKNYSILEAHGICIEEKMIKNDILILDKAFGPVIDIADKYFAHRDKKYVYTKKIVKRKEINKAFELLKNTLVKYCRYFHCQQFCDWPKDGNIIGDAWKNIFTVHWLNK